MKSKELMDIKEITFCLNEGRPVCLHFVILRFPFSKDLKGSLSKLEFVLTPVTLCVSEQGRGGEG